MLVHDVTNFHLSHELLSAFLFLTKKYVALKFCETIENMLVHVGLVHCSLYFSKKNYYIKVFHVYLTVVEKMAEAPSVFNLNLMKNV